MEVAGLGLTVIPLFVSLLDNYGRIIQPFVTFCEYKPAAKKLLLLLKLQRTIFQNQCSLLLEEVAKESLDTIVANKDHPLRKDDKLSDQLHQRLDLLNISYETCVLILLSIRETLDKITRKVQFLEEQTDGKVRFPLRLYVSSFLRFGILTQECLVLDFAG